MLVLVVLACINGTIIHQDEVVRRVRLAERALEDGDARRARNLLSVAADDHLQAELHVLYRWNTLAAVAAMRVGDGRTAEKTFRELVKARKDDPVARAWLAESLADRTGGAAVEAWQIFADLVARDLVPDGFAWSAIARLRHRKGDVAGRDEAVKRCRLVAANKKTCPAFFQLSAR
jgi:hypothetical protein